MTPEPDVTSIAAHAAVGLLDEASMRELLRHIADYEPKVIKRAVQRLAGGIPEEQTAKPGPHDLAEQVSRVRQLHRPIGIFDECGHQHTEEDLIDEVPGVFEVEEVGITCDAGLVYRVCKHCCMRDGYHTEECASDHDHGEDKPICATRAALDGVEGGAR